MAVGSVDRLEEIPERLAFLFAFDPASALERPEVAEVMHEPGARETAVVETGVVILHVDGQRHRLAAGDCVTFDADLPHHFENPGKEEAVLLAVVSAGLRRS